MTGRPVVQPAGVPGDRTVFATDFAATPDTIDELGHVNNAVWVQWIQTCATRHWDAAGDADARARYVWVVVRHEIDYLRAAGPGVSVGALTWIDGQPRGAKCARCVLFHDGAGRVHVRARTDWAMIERATGRPARVTPALLAPFR